MFLEKNFWPTDVCADTRKHYRHRCIFAQSSLLYLLNAYGSAMGREILFPRDNPMFQSLQEMAKDKIKTLLL